MLPWMLEAPLFVLTPDIEAAFGRVLETRDLRWLPSDAPRWVFLQWLARHGWLLHGSRTGDLQDLRPVDVHYNQPDDFSNTRGVYAASDGLWAMMYALRGPNVRTQNDMALQLRLPNGQWSGMRYFLSVAPREAGVRDGRELLGPGFVYLLAREGFTPSPAYEHPGLGFVQEAHWVKGHSVQPRMVVPVVPEDFPLPVRLHDADEVNARAQADPWGFPWLDARDGQ